MLTKVKQISVRVRAARVLSIRGRFLCFPPNNQKVVVLEIKDCVKKHGCRQEICFPLTVIKSGFIIFLPVFDLPEGLLPGSAQSKASVKGTRLD